MRIDYGMGVMLIFGLYETGQTHRVLLPKKQSGGAKLRVKGPHVPSMVIAD